MEAFKEGGPQRELLETALLESLGRYGVKRDAYKRVKALVSRKSSGSCLNIDI